MAYRPVVRPDLFPTENEAELAWHAGLSLIDGDDKPRFFPGLASQLTSQLDQFMSSRDKLFRVLVWLWAFEVLIDPRYTLLGLRDLVANRLEPAMGRLGEQGRRIAAVLVGVLDYGPGFDPFEFGPLTESLEVIPHRVHGGMPKDISVAEFLGDVGRRETGEAEF